MGKGSKRRKSQVPGRFARDEHERIFGKHEKDWAEAIDALDKTKKPEGQKNDNKHLRINAVRGNEQTKRRTEGD